MRFAPESWARIWDDQGHSGRVSFVDQDDSLRLSFGLQQPGSVAQLTRALSSEDMQETLGSVVHSLAPESITGGAFGRLGWVAGPVQTSVDLEAHETSRLSGLALLAVGLGALCTAAVCVASHQRRCEDPLDGLCDSESGEEVKREMRLRLGERAWEGLFEAQIGEAGRRFHSFDACELSHEACRRQLIAWKGWRGGG